MDIKIDTTEDKPLFPMRINKYMARDRNCSRREADEIIRAKRVYINGRLAVLGDKVQEEDKVEVRFHGQKRSANPRESKR